MSFPIIAVTTGANGKFTIAGDQRIRYPNNIDFRVFGSTGNDDLYTVKSTALVTGTQVSGYHEIGLGGPDGINAFQVIDTGGGKTPASATGLIALTYTADITVDFQPTAQSISVNGSLASTYGDLLAQINGQIEVTDVQTPAASTFATVGSASYWTLKSANDATSYYVWYNVTDTGTEVDPAPGGTGIEVKVLSTDPATSVAQKTAVAIDALTDFTVPSPGSDTLRITNAVKGATTDAANVTAGVTVTVIDQGATQQLFGAVIEIVNGQIQVTSESQGDESAISVVDVGPNNLFSSLTGFVAIDPAIPGGVTLQGFQVVDVGSGATNKKLTGLSVTGDATIAVDGGGPQAISVLAVDAPTYFGLITEINIDLTGATASLVDGNIRVTSDTVGGTTAISIVDTDLFSSLTDFIEIKNPVGITGTGLANDATVYTASVVVDGGTAQPISVVGSAAQNYSTLLAEINTDITGATAAIVDGNLRITSATFGPTSTVVITDTNLFSSLNLALQATQSPVSGEEDTQITVFSNVPNATVDGSVFLPGSYLLEFSDDTINPPFMLEPLNIDGPPGTQTSLQLIGRGTLDYGELIMENFMHLLENFASDTASPPVDPIEGQFWWDATLDQMFIWDGATWTSFGVFSGLDDADMDTSIAVEASPDEDVIRFDTGDTPAGYGAVTNIMTLASSGWSVNMGTANVATTAGAPISITSGTGNTTGAGGAISITGGAGGASSADGGAITITGGDGTSRARGGNVTIQGGDSGPVSGPANHGGDVNILGGAVAGTSADGASVIITASSAVGTQARNGGVVTITAGDSSATQVGGAITLTAGDGGTTNGSGGNITFTPGGSSGTGQDGAVVIITETHREFTTQTVSTSAIIGSVAVPTSTTVTFDIFALGRQTGGESLTKKIYGAIENTGGTTAFISSAIEDRVESGAASLNWDITVAANDTNDTLDITVDSATETVDWKVVIKYISVTA